MAPRFNSSRWQDHNSWFFRKLLKKQTDACQVDSISLSETANSRRIGFSSKRARALDILSCLYH